jgi:hypothetical protein
MNDYKSLIQNSILFGNTAPTGAGCAGDWVSQGHNILDGLAGCTFASVPSDLRTNPLLQPPANPLALYLASLPGSPVLDGGNPAGCTDGTNPLTVDQLGRRRPMDGDNDGTPVCDVGAIESLEILDKMRVYLPITLR